LVDTLIYSKHKLVDIENCASGPHKNLQKLAQPQIIMM